MHSTISHTTIHRVSRRSYSEVSQARHLAAVEPCLHSPLAPVDTGR